MANERTLTPRRKEVTIEKMRRHAGPERSIHTDQEKAEEIGMPAPIASGNMLQGYVSEWLFSNFGDAWFEDGRMSLKFVDIVLPGDTLVMEGRITARDDDETEIEIECRVTDGDQTVIVGSATVGTG